MWAGLSCHMYIIADLVYPSHMGKVKHSGGCHCGVVRFEVWAPQDLDVYDCNICTKKQNRHFIVADRDFKITQGEEKLTTYSFDKHVAKHTFCSICGVQSFYTPRSNPNGKGVAIHCLDEGTVRNVTIIKFDGKNWENAMENDTSNIKARSD